MYPRAAWGSLWEFLCGWSYFRVAQSRATAAVAAGFATYSSQFVPVSAAASRALAAALILLLTLVNYRGVRFGAWVRSVFTTLKLLGLLVLIGSAFPGSGPVLSQRFVQEQDLSASQFGSAIVACISSYNVWLALGMMGREIKDPR